MIQRIASTALALLLVGSMNSCIFDPDPKPPTPPKEPIYYDLTQQWHVLHNLQEAYNGSNATRYIEVLDPNDFVFIFDPADAGGNVPPEGQWGYAEESNSARVMLNGGGGLENNPILSIDLELVDYKNATWAEYNPVDFPGWYRTTVSYNFTIETEDETTYITAGTPRAEFTVRKDAGDKWRLVLWSDIATQ